MTSTTAHGPVKNAKPLSWPSAWPVSGADLRGLAQLGADGTLGLTDLVEAMHQTIAARAGLGFGATAAPPGRTSGLTGAIYGAVRGGMRLTGRGVDAALRQVERVVSVQPGGPERDAFLAVLNGVLGDHLADSGNALAIRMALRRDGVALDLSRPGPSTQRAEPSRKLLVLVHGLCMNDRQWSRRGHDHGQALARELGFTPIYLHYNSGRHVWQNGRDLAALLEQLCAHWTGDVDQLAIVGHSMGGLVARSACRQAEAQGQAWRGRLSKLVCLGTPHHGAPLERGGRWVDTLLGLSRYAAPFARLGKTRSAGITDLRFGNTCAAHGPGHDRHGQHRDDRPPMPLPAGVASYLLAATMAAKPGRLQRALIGDGLVPVASALGEHADARLALHVPPLHRHTVHACGHLDLLCHDEVFAKMRAWLGPA